MENIKIANDKIVLTKDVSENVDIKVLQNEYQDLVNRQTATFNWFEDEKAILKQRMDKIIAALTITPIVGVPIPNPLP